MQTPGRFVFGRGGLGAGGDSPFEIAALVKAIDVNGDGRKEIVTFSEDISVLFDRSIGSEPARYGPDAGTAHRQVVHTLAVDLNGDGLPELLNTGGTPMILNPRDIGVTPVEVAGYSGGFMSIPVSLADDGVVRVAVSGAMLRIVSFGPNGLPVSVENYEAPVDLFYTGLCVGDFDGDGLEDIAVTSVDAVQIFRSLGDGTVEWFAEVTASGVVKPAAADLDGDGLADLVVGDISADRVTVLANQGNGVFEAVQSWETTANFWLDLEDLDGDGLLDLAGVNGSTGNAKDAASAAVWYGLPGGGFGDEVIVRSRSLQLEVVSVDLEGNGLKDFVFPGGNPFLTSGSAPDDTTVVYRQTTPRVYEFAGRLPGWVTTGAIAGDFNGDGVMDIATVNGDARRTFVHWGTASACAADLNQNGQADFADIVLYLQRFNSQDPAADLAPVFGSLDFNDVVAFLALYSAGCP